MEKPIVRARHLAAVFLLIKWSKFNRTWCSTCFPGNDLPVSTKQGFEMLVALGYEPNCDFVFDHQNWNDTLERVLRQIQAMNPEKEVNPDPYLQRLWSEVLRGHERLVQSVISEDVGITLRRLLLDALRLGLPTQVRARKFA